MVDNRKKPRATETVGAKGTAVHGGFIVTNEKQQKLTGTTKYITFSEQLVNTAIVGAGVRYFLNLVAKAGWTVVPADDSEAAGEAAEFLDEVLNDMDTPFARVVRRAAMYRFYGFSVQEWTAKSRPDGSKGLLDVEPRPQSTIERWDVDTKTGRVLGMWQRVPQDGREVYLSRGKVVYTVDDSLSDSPEGLGLFRHLEPVVNKLQKYLSLEASGFVTDLRGVPLGRIPYAILQQMQDRGEITSQQRLAMEDTLENFVKYKLRDIDTGVCLDSSTYQSQDEKGSPSQVKLWDLELLKGGTTALPEMGKAIIRLNHDAARLIGVEHLLLGADSKGSHALSQDKTHNFFLIVDSTLRELGEAFEKDLIDPLWTLNGLNPDLKPTLQPEEIRFRDVEQVTGALADLSQAGAPLLPDDPAINEVRDLVGLSRVDEGMVDSGLLPGNQPKPPGDKVPEKNDPEEE